MVYINKKNIIGKNLKDIRVSQNVTQEELAARLQVIGLKLDRTMISKIESQSRNVLDSEVKAISDALSIPIQNLFNYKK